MFLDKRLTFVILSLLFIPLFDLLLPEWARLAPLMPTVLIFALIGLGLTVVTGFTGLLHLGVAAFVAIGAYTFAIATCSSYPFQIPWGIALLLAGLVGGASGFLLGLPTLRLRGDYLAIVTLGFGEIVQDVLRNLDLITKGTQGINPLPGPNFGWGELGSSSTVSWYYLIVGIIILVTLGLERLLVSPIGRSWLAVRDDELAASCMGVNPVAVKLSTFAISAGLSAMGGALMASFLGTSGEPSNFDFQVSIMVLSLIIVGGIGSLPGAILGAVVMVGVNSILLAKVADWLAATQGIPSANVFISPGNWKYLIFGLSLVLMMRFKKEGFLPALKTSRRASE
jgi:branched-chain amino acid transport system permease protein